MLTIKGWRTFVALLRTFVRTFVPISLSLDISYLFPRV
jgi:hypothetical protein